MYKKRAEMAEKEFFLPLNAKKVEKNLEDKPNYL